MSPDDDEFFSWQDELALCGLTALVMLAGSIFVATLMYQRGSATFISGLVAMGGLLRTLRKTRGG